MTSVIDHLAGYVALTPSGCLVWTGRKTKDGYGETRVGGRRRAVHIVAFEALVGPVPEGLDVGHVCHDQDETCPGGRCEHRACVHPDHLAPQTRSENIRSGRWAAAQRARWAATETCASGRHRWADGNAYVYPNGKRRCRSCQRECRQRRDALAAARG